jgi:cytochrome c oxidase assembly factor CtaG
MKCFRHSNEDSVGICCNCFKGLCHACSVEVNSQLACADSCVETVQQIGSLVRANIASDQVISAGWANLLLPVFFMAAGLLFVSYGLWVAQSPKTASFNLALGGLLAVFGCASFFIVRRLQRRIKR